MRRLKFRFDARAIFVLATGDMSELPVQIESISRLIGSAYEKNDNFSRLEIKAIAQALRAKAALTVA